MAARYKEDGMLAYVELIQRKEREIGCDVLTHQKWHVVILCGPWHVSELFFSRSGANYIDRILQTVSSGSSSTSATGKDSTENSFWAGLVYHYVLCLKCMKSDFIYNTRAPVHRGVPGTRLDKVLIWTDFRWLSTVHMSRKNVIGEIRLSRWHVGRHQNSEIKTL